MPERWVVNASPLILLARVGQAHLLLSLADEVVVPEAVAREIAAGPEEDAARRWLASAPLPIVATPPAPPALLAWDLGAGETSVLAQALANPGWTAILDDGAARRCAASLALPVKGTLAVVVLARRRGLIPSAADLVRELQTSGFRIDGALVRTVLAQAVGEQWPGEP